MADAGQMFEKFLKLPDHQKLIALGALIVLLSVGYYYGIHAPKVLELESRQNELTKLNAQYSEQQRVLANIDNFRNELRAMQVQFEESLKQLPNSSEIPALLSNISALAQESGLEILLFKPAPELAKGFYADIPVAMEVKGNYHDIGYFFDKVASLDRIVNIENISMAPAKAQAKGMQLESRLHAKFTIVTFKFIDEVKAQVPAKGKRRQRGKKAAAGDDGL
ncbi:MAG: pilus assembly protein PilO [Deltaproteobacteria bacterium]|nr:pilus assembly protein PilO [Deltaproteobacteria bacterium]